MNKKTKQTLYTILIFAAGIVLGILAGYIGIKASGGGTILRTIGEIGSGLALWAFLGTLIAYYSKNPKLAAFRVLLFYLGILVSYYICASLWAGVPPLKEIGKWLILAVVAALAGALIWFAKRKGWFGAFCAALPIGFLAAEGRFFYQTLKTDQIVTIIFAFVLFLLLPRQKGQRARAVPFMILIVLISIKFDVIAGLIQGLLKM